MGREFTKVSDQDSSDSDGWNRQPAMRCFFMRAGYVYAVEVLANLSTEDPLKVSHQMFEARARREQYEGFMLWFGMRKIASFSGTVL